MNQSNNDPFWIPFPECSPPKNGLYVVLMDRWAKDNPLERIGYFSKESNDGQWKLPGEIISVTIDCYAWAFLDMENLPKDDPYSQQLRHYGKEYLEKYINLGNSVIDCLKKLNIYGTT